MLIFGDTLKNMKTENRMKKKFVQPLKGAKKILAQPNGEKKKLPNPRPRRADRNRAYYTIFRYRKYRI